MRVLPRPFLGKRLANGFGPQPLYRKVEFLEEALEEAEQASAWYAERSERAAAEFAAELDRAVAGIVDNPLAWPKARHGTRRRLLWRFPFSVVFRIEPGRLVIVAVAHTSRKPEYWSRRTPQGEEAD